MDLSRLLIVSNRFSNQGLWPLFRYLIDRVPVDAAGWDVDREVNEIFAAAVASHYRSGDTIWVHDYQLMLVPALLRQRLPEARIGFFLHIPFPSSEVFRILLWRRRISKAVVAHEPSTERGRRVTVAFGDDRTDEDLFRALPESSITVAVGRDLTGARYRVSDHREVRQLLRSLAESGQVA